MSIITLLGIMCCGKTTVGKNLECISKKKHFDTDVIIEEKMPTIEIFKRYGEQHFRVLEYQVISDLIKGNKNCIISVGGGAFIQENVRSLLLQHTKTVWLKIGLKTALARLKRDKVNNRPLAHLLNEEFLQYRNKMYSEAHLHITCDQLTLNEIVKLISSSFPFFHPFASYDG